MTNVFFSLFGQKSPWVDHEFEWVYEEASGSVSALAEHATLTSTEKSCLALSVRRLKICFCLPREVQQETIF